MATWTGPAPVGPTALTSIRSWADDRSNGWTNPDGSPVEWWESLTEETFGVQYPSPPCSGATCEEIHPCATCEDLGCDECEDDCPLPDAPGWLDYKPFWIRHGYRGCDRAPYNAQALYDQAVNELAEVQWAQVARHYHKCLQAEATDITGDEVSTLTEGVGLLLRARGVLGLGWGGIVAPGYALPAMSSKGLLEQGGGQLTLAGTGIPVFTDPGIPVSGPGGAAPPPGAAYIYIVNGPPTVAVRDEVYPGGTDWSWEDSTARAMFFNELCGCGGCFQPFAKRRAIVACHGCAVFAVAVDVRDCDCPDALLAPAPVEGEGGATEEGGVQEETKGKTAVTETAEKTSATVEKRAG